MKIAIGSDHAGFNLKEHLKRYLERKGYAVLDQGTEKAERCDYPDFAQKVCLLIQEEEVRQGILVCGTGIGMSMMANKFQGIRAAVVSDPFSAAATKKHNDANVLCLGERIVGTGVAEAIVDAWSEALFEGGRHKERIDKIMNFEKNNLSK
jgi:ribose 5-phosphate isomerase B